VTDNNDQGNDAKLNDDQTNIKGLSSEEQAVEQRLELMTATAAPWQQR